jgi:hypothetical protein
VIEVKGQQSAVTEVKHRALDEWTRAVNGQGGFGWWAWGVARSPSSIMDIIEEKRRSALGSGDEAAPNDASPTP